MVDIGAGSKKNYVRDFGREGMSTHIKLSNSEMQKQSFGFLETVKTLGGDYLNKKTYMMEMSRYVQSKNPLNLKYTQYQICFSEWSVAKRGKTDSCATVRLRFFGSRLTILCT